VASGTSAHCFELDKEKFKEPILVSSADGVGTKLKVAIAMNVHSTVGGDLVNHCVNDILVQVPSRCFFWTIWRWGKWIRMSWSNSLTNEPRVPQSGLRADWRRNRGDAGIFTVRAKYDLAGFIVARVEKKKLLTGKNVKPGDTLLALPAAGLHTNGYSLPANWFFEVAKLKLTLTSPRWAIKSEQNF